MAAEPTRQAGPPVASGAWTPAFGRTGWAGKTTNTIRTARTVRGI